MLTCVVMRPFTPNQVLAYNVNRLRLDHKWTLSQLAEKVNVNRGTQWTKHTVLKIEDYSEKGSVGRKVSMDELVALAIVFRVSVIELLLPPEDGRVDLGPVGIKDWKHVRDRYEYAAVAFHFPESEPTLSEPGLWTRLAGMVEDERKASDNAALAEANKAIQEMLRRIGAASLSKEDLERIIEQREKEAEDGDNS